MTIEPTLLHTFFDRFAPNPVVLDSALRASLQRAGINLHETDDEPEASTCHVERIDPQADMAQVVGGLRARLTDRGRLVLLCPMPDPPRTTLALRLAVQPLVLATAHAGFVLLAEEWLGLEGQPHAAIVVRRDDIVLRPAREADDEAVELLSRRVFHVQREPALWRWKYGANPYRTQTRTVAFMDEDGSGTLAAHYGAVPTRLRHSPAEGPSRTLDALQYCDIMTAAGVRTRGRGRTAVISRAIRHLYAAFAEQRVDFGFGFNTATSRAMAVRFHGGTELEGVGFWRRPTDGGAIQDAPKRFRISQFAHVDRRFDGLFERVAPAYRLLAVRDARYLGWRYLTRPDVSYLLLAARRWRRLVGWAAFRRIDDRLVWGDGLIDPRYPEAGPALLQTALGTEVGQGVTSIETWAPNRPDFWSTMLTRAGFVQAPEPNDLSIVYGAQREATIGEILPQWFYTMGDSDLF